MSRTADQMSRASLRGRDLDVAVKDVLEIVDARLTAAQCCLGKNVVSVELPETFVELKTLTRSEAQLIVYGLVVADLEKRGFEVRLRLCTTAVPARASVIYVSWVSKIDGAVLAQLTASVRASLVSEAEEQALIALANRSSPTRARPPPRPSAAAENRASPRP